MQRYCRNPRHTTLSIPTGYTTPSPPTLPPFSFALRSARAPRAGRVARVANCQTSALAPSSRSSREEEWGGGGVDSPRPPPPYLPPPPLSLSQTSLTIAFPFPITVRPPLPFRWRCDARRSHSLTVPLAVFCRDSGCCSTSPISFCTCLNSATGPRWRKQEKKPVLD